MRQFIGIMFALVVSGCSDSGGGDAAAGAPAGTAAPPRTAEAPVAAEAPAAAGTPDWLPAALRLPEDAEIVAARSFGSATRVLQVRTGVDREALLDRYLTALDEAGYATRQTDDRVLFEGRGVDEGSVAFADTVDQGPLLQIDLMLGNP